MTTHEIVRDLANFKMYKTECTPHTPLRSTSTCSDLYTGSSPNTILPFLKGVTSIVVTPQT